MQQSACLQTLRLKPLTTTANLYVSILLLSIILHTHTHIHTHTFKKKKSFFCLFFNDLEISTADFMAASSVQKAI